jgi:predicted O-linked N-acetylglucosamine transferase (SPINDLY family)
MTSQMTIQQQLESGVSHHRAGRLAQARAIYLEVLALDPSLPEPLDLLGVIAIQTGQFDQAIEWIRQAIAINPRIAGYHSHLGNALRGKGQYDEAIAAWRVAIGLKGDFAEAYANLGNALRETGQIKEAVEVCRQAVRLNPGSFEALTNLGAALQETGQSDEAITAYRQALRINPNVAEIHNNLGNALRDTKQLDEAIVEFQRAVELKPESADIHRNLGTALYDKGRIDAAIAAHRQAIRLKPDYAEAYTNLGVALTDNGQLDEAMSACRQAIRLKPGFAEAYINLGNTLKRKGQLDDAITCYRQAIGFKPDCAIAYINLADTVGAIGQLGEEITCYREAIRLKPDDRETHSKLVFSMNYHPAYDAAAILREARQWDERHCKPLRHLIQPHKNSRDADRPLRIGYVSEDYFERAPAPFFLLPLFRHHDQRRFMLFCYDQQATSDKMTQQMQDQIPHWRKIAKLTDAQVAALVREDQIDILVDLKLHTNGNRLMVFARKPAPVQMTWLGYPGTTGMATMDYRLTDPYLDPPGETDASYAEKSIWLPDTYWVYDPLCDEPAANAPPCLEKGFVTFGCLNNFSKVNDGLLSLWAKVLNGNPSSRLLLLTPEGSARRWTLDRLGVGPERVEFVPTQSRSEYLHTYDRIDIVLDTLPYNGHTTSLDALWMGVPVVSLSGSTAVGRVGRSSLHNLGLADLVANDPDQYVRLAVDLAGDLAKLSELRQTLRDRMEASPLMDAPRFARNVEAAYRQMWRNWCEGGGVSGLQCPAP